MIVEYDLESFRRVLTQPNFFQPNNVVCVLCHTPLGIRGTAPAMKVGGKATQQTSQYVHNLKLGCPRRI